MKKSRLIIPIAILVGCVGSSLPLAASPKLTSELSQKAILLSDTVTLSISIEWPQGEGEYLFTLPDLALENLILRRQGQSSEIFNLNGQNIIRRIFRFDFQGKAAGKAAINAFTITYLRPDDVEASELSIPGQELVIQPSKSNMAWITGGLAALVTGMMISFWAWRRRKILERSKASDAIKQPLSLCDEAIDKIKSLLSTDSSEQHATTLSNMSSQFMKFLVGHYHLEACKLTETEMKNKLSHASLDPKDFDRLSRLLDKTHEAKYSGLMLTANEIKSLADEMIRFIEGKRILG